MSITIRPYKETDFQTIQKWSPRIWKSLFPDTTYIAEIDGVPSVCLCLYLMNSPDACMVENLFSDPTQKGPARKEAVNLLFKHLEEVAKSLGYKTLVLFSYEDKLKLRYEEIGYVRTVDNVTTYAKSL
jgi:hypothetical protein